MKNKTDILKNKNTHAKNHFIAKLTHEMRSPLNGIIGFAELMYNQKTGSVSAEHKEYLSDILTSARYLLTLINDILDMSQARTGKILLNPEKIHVAKILQETEKNFKTLIQQKNITFKTEIDTELPTIVIDPMRLKQIIFNFVSNALKCTPDNGNVTVRIMQDANNFFRIEVEDTGIGIRKEDLPRLFIEFEQINQDIAHKYPSTGLGLALTKQLVEAQQGRVNVKSVFGKGSTFYAFLPCMPQSNDVGKFEG